MSKKITIALPVEVPLREWYPKAILAGKLAAVGYRVILGRDYHVSNIAQPPIIYVGKNHVHYKRICNKGSKGNKFVYFDDENAPITGSLEQTERIVRTRLWPEILKEVDIITTWGSFQKTIFSSITDKEVVVVGAPQIEICKPEYAESLKVVDNEVTQGVADYVLLNTRFPYLNGFHKLSDVDPQKPFWLSGREEKDFRLEIRDELNCLSDNLLLLERLSAEEEIKSIVIRPHPMECENTYKWLFKDFPKVSVFKTGHVIPWIRKSKAVIASGCTTSIQSAVAKKPIFNYRSRIENEVESYADTVGDVYRDLDMLVDHLKKCYESSQKTYPSHDWSDSLDLFSLGINPLNAIAEVLDKLGPLVNATEANPFRNINPFYRAKETTKKLIFDRSDPESLVVQRAISNFCQSSNSNLSIQKLLDGCFVIETYA